MSNEAKVYEKVITIPTYAVGEAEKNPMFLEKRVYQGSSGKVYPYQVIEKIYDEKQDKDYTAVILENDWLYVVVLPELGGRIYTAYDKTNRYDFVYHNQVIKPALVGLVGPWISGGIEFNWPQHHRPTTYMKVNFNIEKNESEGSASVYVGETEGMSGLKHTTKISLYQDKSYIEITTDVYNPNPTTETFLWWANPAYKVNDFTKTIMPKDVTAVLDHGRRAVSTFPIAHGEYYKMDYSSGVDISRYKNIPVPTSFMAHISNFDFVGGYDYEKKAGLLHVADHHLSPGKKQWTWGNGDFGRAWDRNLTDEDGAYVELMTGCFTDNQPDFTFIAPQETKNFTQYFMPYHDVGEISNANKDVCFGTEGGYLTIFANARIKGKVTIKDKGKVVSQLIDLTPMKSIQLGDVTEQSEIEIEYDGKKLRYSPIEIEKFPIPDAATACPNPKDTDTTENLYLFGLHLEQYRHATRNPLDYYKEGLSRDNSDIRLNNAYGLLNLRKGNLDIAKECFLKAIAKLNTKNANPITTEPHFNLGYAYFLDKEYNLAYDCFYKCLWGNQRKAEALYYMACIDYRRQNIDKALEHIKNSIAYNGLNLKAYNLQAIIADKLADENLFKISIATVLKIDKLNVVARLLNEKTDSNTLAITLQRITTMETLNAVGDLYEAGDYERASQLLKCKLDVVGSNPLLFAHLAYSNINNGIPYANYIEHIGDISKMQELTFANSLNDIIVLNAIINIADNYYVHYLLGNLYYSKGEYSKAAKQWIRSVELNAEFPTPRRNLALYFFNKTKEKAKALEYLRGAYNLDKSDSRVMYELYELEKVSGANVKELKAFVLGNLEIAEKRDDLYLEYIRLILLTETADDASKLLLGRKFHPWEGGEGKATKLYKDICIAKAYQLEVQGDLVAAIDKLKDALVLPENLGEGKLVLDYDNDIYYLMGNLAEKNGDITTAKTCWSMATRGNYEIKDNMYYNDAPIDYVYFKAKAYKKLGNNEKVKDIKESFNRFYSCNINKICEIDYFAVSLPDMLIWECDINEQNINFCKKIKDLAEDI